MKKILASFTSLFIMGMALGQTITGSWLGNLDVQGTKLPLVFHIRQPGDSLTTTMDSPAQGAKGIPVGKTTFQDNELTLEAPNLSIVYKGKLHDSIIEGNFSQGMLNVPLILKRISDKELNTVQSAVKTDSVYFPDDYAGCLKRVEDYIAYLVKNNQVAGAVCVHKNGKEIYRKYFGQDSLPASAKGKTTFQIGSVTKTLTAVMIFQLIEKGRLSLNDKLSKFYPQIPKADSVTITQLLNHTSGLGDYVDKKNGELFWLVNKVNEKEIFDEIICQGSLFSPGKDERYSNSGYFLLAKIIEKITQKPYHVNVRERILHPLQMRHTFSAKEKNIMVFPSYEYLGKWQLKKDFYFENVVGVGDLAAVPADLNRFADALFGHQLLKEESLKKMLPGIEKNKRTGLGIFTVPFGRKMFFGHSGGTYGTYSLLIYNPEDKLSVAYSLNAVRFNANDFAIGLLSMLYDVKSYKYPVFARIIPLTEADMRPFTGIFAGDSTSLKLKVFVKNTILHAQLSEQDSFPLECIEANTFQYTPVNVKLVFSADRQQIVLYQNGAEIVFRREG